MKLQVFKQLSQNSIVCGDQDQDLEPGLTLKKTLCFLQQTRLPHSGVHILEMSSSCSSAIPQFYKSKTTLLLGHTSHLFP